MTGYTAAVKGSEVSARHPYPYTEPTPHFD